ncbi:MULTISPECIES: class I SAM-dependent DNA methyltransferase [unclassified Mesorhizobium]|uniref:class I SAM-dependent DNA methyltransferase n=1 Tax=unclassified Mesorhizobium TaxID=325217 RepID=UPI0011271841|nr:MULTISPECIES: DNA methyltransferase [unclassified Mesorhizobium]MBZ9703243.1 class I SAM-dependent DNA methyltransferase [Mesorhizobium sp. CO1-1-3]MBZ9947094.1 class I SAM-dependent DNA methyltransferase [Mesorhizobium sp. BR1-1-11]TPJ06681.1 class I SAM-dependent DNA methyltransferase [Mesorhizobium sp. B2-8-1]
MNPVEIEEAISALASAPFEPDEFPYAFLEAFGNKETTLKKLRSGVSNKSDLGGVLQTNNIHIAVSPRGDVTRTLVALKASPATARAKARFILATDGDMFEAEDLIGGDTIACAYPEFPDHFGVFLPLAGITTVKQLRDSSFDIKATGRLNRLYIQLLKDNPDWSTAERRGDMNHFMARLIFCFFSEDTDIFEAPDLFTGTIEQMSAGDSSNTHEVISTLFRAMNIKSADRAQAKLPRWADRFPYVNGGLFSGNAAVPVFTRIARSYLIHIGRLDWKKINPDIFGSMIQAVADDEERGALGMHYTSVPNILKVLNPLFLDDLREKLEEAADNTRKLLNLRNRMARIRVFDPACGSGNFLVIAYKEMRAIEAVINDRRGEPDRRTEIPLTNFRGIELRDFPAEIARLALIIAEYQCDVLYRGQKEALRDFLPLDAQNWIYSGNALRVDWLSICPPTGTAVIHQADDLFHTPLDQAEIDFENEGGETFICGNPPYKGTKNQTNEQKDDLRSVFEGYTDTYKSLDYVAGWFFKAALYGQETVSKSAFVSTNSICQGGQVPLLWPLVFQRGNKILFAHTSFLWRNLAAHNAGVTVAIIGFGVSTDQRRLIYTEEKGGLVSVREATNINAYLVPSRDIIVEGSTRPRNGLPRMSLGNQPYEGNFLILEHHEFSELSEAELAYFTKNFYGSSEFIRGGRRKCLWLTNEVREQALTVKSISERVKNVRAWRLASTRPATRAMASRPHQFCEMNIGRSQTIIIPIRSSESREYLPVGLLDNNCVVSNLAYALYDAPIWCLAIIASKLHLSWIATICGRMKSDYSYSNKMGWHTFPVPPLSQKNKADLTRCAQDILLAREAHFPATIADLYDPENMPADLRAAHSRNDEVLERIYIGRRFKNDTERLEKLFELYTKLTAGGQAGPKVGAV